MKEYKPTLEIVKNKYYVCMTVPKEVGAKMIWAWSNQDETAIYALVEM